MSRVRDFIAEHPTDWLARLERDYKILVSRDAGLVSLKYDQLESPMADPLVQECRGMVVRESTGEILAWPYNKFWNHGEALAAAIDWDTARVLEKLDGSLMILYRDPEAPLEHLDTRRFGWCVASSGTPCASGSFGRGGEETFTQAFWRIFDELDMSLPPHQDTCFMFELCAQENRIVVKHERERLVLHGARNVRHGDEMSVADLHEVGFMCHWEVVKSYPLHSAAEALAGAAELDPLQTEGFVVVDAQHSRVKIKSPRYVALHHMRGEGMSVGRAVDLWVAGEVEELLSHFPEFHDDVMGVVEKMHEHAAAAFVAWRDNQGAATQKDYAMAVKDKPWAALAFKLRASAEAPTAALAVSLLRQQTRASLVRIAGEP